MEKIRMRELVQATSDEMGISTRDIREIVNVFFETIGAELGKGNEITISPYVKFAHTYVMPVKKGTMVRNPLTGTEQPSAGRPAKIRIRARALKGLQSMAPGPSSKAGKPIADAAKEKRAARAAKAA